MSTTLTTSFTLSVARSFLYRSANSGPYTDDSNTFSLQDSLSNGTGADQADLLYHTVHTLTTGSSVLIDMSGTEVTPFGETIVMARIKTLVIRHNGTAGSITFGGGSNAISTFFGTNGDGIKIQGDGLFMLHAPDATGYVVTAGTAENIRLLHNGDVSDDIDVEIIVIGASA
jgi:hypothetical protein